MFCSYQRYQSFNEWLDDEILETEKWAKRLQASVYDYMDAGDLEKAAERSIVAIKAEALTDQLKGVKEAFGDFEERPPRPQRFDPYRQHPAYIPERSTPPKLDDRDDPRPPLDKFR